MRTRRSSADHTEAVARRLALLSAELDAARLGPRPGDFEGDGAPALTRVSGAALPLDTEALAPWAPLGMSETGVSEAGVNEAGVNEAGARPLVQALPVPGRHAARAPFSWGRGAIAWAPGQVSIVLAGGVLALALTCAWLLLGQEQAQVKPLSAPPAETSVAPVLSEAALEQPATASPSEVSEVVVHVAGRVRRPGIVVLPAGSRVGEAITRAGGARKEKDTHGLNLARVLVDGEQVYVGADVPPGVAPLSSATGAVPGAASVLVSINSADGPLLETLPGIGPVTAAAIIEWRTRHGGFTAVEELLEVRGIGDATLEQILPLVTL